MILAGQLVGQVAGALAGPAQRRLRIAPRGWLDQRFQRGQQVRIGLDQWFAPAAGPAHTRRLDRPRSKGQLEFP
jgi:hypothetical protein